LSGEGVEDGWLEIGNYFRFDSESLRAYIVLGLVNSRDGVFDLDDDKKDDVVNTDTLGGSQESNISRSIPTISSASA